MDDLKKVNVGHAMLAPLVMAARMCHQLPIAVDNLVHSRDTDFPALRSETDCKSPDVVFNEDVWSCYQCVMWGFYKQSYAKLVPMLRTRLRRWSMANFNKPDTCALITIDDGHPAYTGDRSTQFSEIVRWLDGMRPSELLGAYAHVVFQVPSCQLLVGFLDHYSCDGSILFDYFGKVLGVEGSKLTLPTYRYIPLVTDAITAEAVIRNAYHLWRHPTQITTCGSNLVGSTNVLHKADMYQWSRWGNYGECLLRIFERLEGVRADLGKVVHGAPQQPPICRPIPAYLHVCITVGIETDRRFGNNRTGCVTIQVVRPEPTKTRNERLDDLIAQIKTQCTENRSDAISTYDMVRGFDTSKLRGSYGANSFDVMLAGFRVTDQHTEQVDLGFGGFVGHVDYPYMYIGGTTSSEISVVSYTTNWW